MDLVGRKLPMRAGGVMNDFRHRRHRRGAGRLGRGPAAIGKHLAEAHATLRQTTD
jgi:hypothetical protein